MHDFLAQLSTEMNRILPTRSRREKDAFAALDVHEQTWRFLNWQSRLVHPHPRQVNVADGFDGLPGVRVNRAAVDALLGSLARGDDVRGHLSKGVMEGYRLHPPGRKDGPDFDLMLNEWGIHHLHLDGSPGPGFKPRTRDVLYAILGRGAAYVLAVAPHGAWTSRQLIAAAQRSWPHQGLFVPLGVMPGRDWTEDEHKALRRAGTTTAAVQDGKPWISGIALGLTTTLVSVRVSKESSHVLHQVRRASEHEGELMAGLRRNAHLNGMAWPAVPEVHLKAVSAPDRYCFAFVEEQSGATLVVAPPWAATKRGGKTVVPGNTWLWASPGRVRADGPASSPLVVARLFECVRVASVG